MEHSHPRKRREEEELPNKRLKKKTEKEETRVWDLPIPEEGDEKLFTFLVGEITQQQFFSNNWQERHFFNSSRGTAYLKNYELIPFNIKRFINGNSLLYKEDVSIIQYDMEADEIMEKDIRGPVKWEEVSASLESGWAIRFLRPFSFLPHLAQLLMQFNYFWGGNEEARMEMTYSFRGCSPFAPACDGHDTFIFQIQGCQEIFLFKNPDEGEQDSNKVIVFDQKELSNFTRIDQVLLEPGNSIYIPHKYVTYCRTESELSLDLNIALPTQPNWVNILNTSLEIARKTLNFETTQKYLPSFTAPTQMETNMAQAKEKAAQVLHLGMKLCDKISDDFEKKKKFTKLHFDARQWVEGYNLLKLLEDNKGLVKISNFLPPTIAERIAQVLSEIREDQWLSTESEQDYENNNIAHSFVSCKEFSHSENIFSIFRRLLPKEITLSAARYTQGHFIAPHDDKALKNINDVVYEREIAFIYYLTHNWTLAEGGTLIDIDGKQTYIPEFNSLIAFIVPRNHEVTVMTTDRPRLSIFGWFLRPYGVESAE